MGKIKTLIKEEALPFFEVVEITGEVHGICDDPDDDKFISCAAAASADIVVTGDNALCAAAGYKTVRIIRATEFLRMMKIE